jgi:hypothetical protein
MSLRNDFRTARRTSGKEWRLLVEAGGLLVAARLAVWLVPFRRLAAHLGDEMAESPADDTEAQRAAAAPIGRAVRTLGRRLPWMSQCLVQAVSATWMLQRRRIPSTLYFGVAKDSNGKVTAHAWVRCGTQVLTGAKERHEFSVVATFAAPLLATGSNLVIPPIMASSDQRQPDERDLR